MRDPLTAYPGYALRRAANAAGVELASRLAVLGMRQSDASVLMLIGANSGATSSALGRQLDIQRANMVPLLKRLEDAGWIKRAPLDGKSRGLHLTPAGEQALARAQGVIETFEREMLERVPHEHRGHLLPALDALWR